MQRVLALLDYLSDLYALRYPPVRDITSCGHFLLREHDVPGAPGVDLTANGETWLACELATPLPAPDVPEELQDFVERDRLSPHARPVFELSHHLTEKDSELARAFGKWVDDVWEPWSARAGAVERSRELFKRMFDLRNQLERDRESLELVWGFGRLRWTPTDNVTIDHPLLTVSIEVIYDHTANRLRVVPGGDAVVEYGYLSDVELADRAALSSRDRTTDIVPRDVWDGASRSRLYRDLLRSIAHDGLVDESGAPSQPGPHAAVWDEWVLYVRRRVIDYVGFLSAQREMCAGGVPVTSPFLSLVVDEPSRLAEEPDIPAARESLLPLPAMGEQLLLPFPAACEQLSLPFPAVSDEPLFPLPANDEQRRILNLARRRSGVTVQAPPGTGKSHTIANLLSHYVAHGQRVLVTAEKEQALSDLAAKVPPGMRDLTVSFLGSNEVERSRLDRAIHAIHEGVWRFDRSSNDRDITQLEAQIDRIDRNIASATAALRNARAAEVDKIRGTFEVGADPTPSQAARWLSGQEAELAYIPDELALDASPPITAAELAELAELAGIVEPGDVGHAATHRPSAGLLPDGSRLAQWHSELAGLRERRVSFETHIEDREPIEGDEPFELDILARDTAAAREWFDKIAGSWHQTVLDDVADPLLAAEWSEFADQVSAEREAILTNRQRLDAHSVSVSAGDTPTHDLVDALRSAHGRLGSGKGIGRFHRTERKALEKCTVDGEVPGDARAVDLCLLEISCRRQRITLRARWANRLWLIGGPILDETTLVEDAVAEHLAAIRGVLEWRTATWRELRRRLAVVSIEAADDPDHNEIRRVAEVCALERLRRDERELTGRFDELDAQLAEGAGAENASPLWGQLADCLRTRLWDGWERARAEAARIAELVPHARRVGSLRERLATRAPVWTQQIVASRGAAAGSPETFDRAWQWRQLQTTVGALLHGADPAELQLRIEELGQARLRTIEELVVARAWRRFVGDFDDRKRSALSRYLQTTGQYGKTEGRFVTPGRRAIHGALDEAKDAVPVWIMPINRVLSSFKPAAEPPFDVLIVDEASGVGIGALPVLALARKAIVVGDDKQTSPVKVGLERGAMLQLIAQHLRDIPAHRVRFDPDNSLYDLSKQQWPEVVLLREHFRSLPAIIAFSSNRYYDGRIVALHDQAPQPQWKPTRTVLVDDGHHDPDRQVNDREAETIVDLITGLCDDPTYDGMTFGVIGLLGTAQAHHIWSKLFDRLGPDVLEEREIRCGEAADFEDNGRDVMILSLVVSADQNGQRIDGMTGVPSQRRINVAASRARDQLWVVHSAQPDDFPYGDPRAALIRHCNKPYDVETTHAHLEERCESELERLVLRRVLARGYERVQTQHEVGHYRIGLVVEGADARLAVECDSDQWHGRDRWDEDRARQAVLERAGWTFLRIRGSAFFRDPDAALEPLWERLDDLGIATTSSGSSGEPSPAADMEPSGRRIDARDHHDELAPITPIHWTPPATEETEKRAGERLRIVSERRDLLEPYVEWAPHPLDARAMAHTRDVIEGLAQIVQAEGPIHARRAYQLYIHAAGGQQFGREIRQAFSHAARQAVRRGQILAIKDSIDGMIGKTLYAPGSSPVVPRERGPRSLEDIPRSEIATLIDALGLREEPSIEWQRAILDVYGLVDLTERARQYLDECFGYTWRP